MGRIVVNINNNPDAVSTAVLILGYEDLHCEIRYFQTINSHKIYY